MSEIARQAGVDPSSFYYYFASKEALIESILNPNERIPTAEDLEIKAQAAQNVEMSKIIDDNGRLDFSSLRAAQPEQAAPVEEPAQQPKIFERTLHVRYTAEQGRELIEALNKIGLEYKLI